jgi:hypothetical protein
METSEIFISILDMMGRRSEYQIKKNSKIEDLKILLLEKYSNLSFEDIRLLFDSKYLEDKRSLSDYNI